MMPQAISSGIRLGRAQPASRLNSVALTVTPLTVMDSMLKLYRVFAAITIYLLWPSLPVDAQVPPPNGSVPGAYEPVPDYVGSSAGLSFRNAINDRFSGVQPTSPKIVNLNFVNLPGDQDGLLIFCRDCQPTIPCSNGGPGAWAFGQNGVWSCTAPNVPGN